MKCLVLITMVLGVTELAMALDAAVPPAKRILTQREMPLRLLPSRLPRPRPAWQAAPTAIPEQFSPPQEAYAAFPESAGAGAASAAKPTDCDLRLAKIAIFKPLSILAGPGECGADAVLLDGVILPDRAQVAVTPRRHCAARWRKRSRLGCPRMLRRLRSSLGHRCEHGRANALDIRGFKLANGEEIELTDVNVAKDWREALRGSLCEGFSTVLGPVRTAITRNTSTSISPSGERITRRASGRCASR